MRRFSHQREMKKQIKFLSDCHLAPVVNIQDEKGICEQCKQECWACEPEKLKPVSLQHIIEAVKRKEFLTKKQ